MPPPLTMRFTQLTRSLFGHKYLRTVSALITWALLQHSVPEDVRGLRSVGKNVAYVVWFLQDFCQPALGYEAVLVDIGASERKINVVISLANKSFDLLILQCIFLGYTSTVLLVMYASSWFVAHKTRARKCTNVSETCMTCAKILKRKLLLPSQVFEQNWSSCQIIWWRECDKSIRSKKFCEDNSSSDWSILPKSLRPIETAVIPTNHKLASAFSTNHR